VTRDLKKTLKSLRTFGIFEFVKVRYPYKRQ